MQDNSKSNALIVTFLFPFVGLIQSLANWRRPWAKNSFWLACVYMGAVFVFWPEGTILGAGGDGGRYVLRLMEMYNNASITLSSILSSYLKDPRVMDLYQQLTTFIVSRFTDNGHVLFAVYAVVFGFFYSRNIWYVLERLPNKRLGNLVVLLSLYFLICPITQINGVRMWTALHMFVYGMMPYLLENDRSKIWWIAITPFIHFSFLYVAILGLLWFALSMRGKSTYYVTVVLSYSFFAISLLLNSMNINGMEGIIEEYTPDGFEEKISGYYSDEYLERIAESKAQKNWYVGMSGIVSHWSYSLLLLFLWPVLKRHKQNECWMSLYVFSLVMGGFANVMSLMPSGGRFQLLSQMFQVPLLLIVCMNIPTGERFRKMVNYASVLLLLPLVFQIRQLFDYYSITLLFGNFITLFIWENNILLMDIIKTLI